MKLRHLPPRLAAGAYVLNSGLSKRGADEATAAGMHGMAAGAYPFLSELEPQQFVRLLSAAEIALGVALLLPGVPTRLAALGLGAFSGGLLGMYVRTPGLHGEGWDLRPSPDGIGMAKDVFLAGIAGGLLLDRGR
ncbi:DoxX family membrane protein [Cellulomonas endophytica]|uniref:DoxX family membrane protein n=1 Tax=Cellulomonas endophytica TaxID=2494735 RepID=UPI00196A2D68|nr:DoxX family membrane protein [Cellulomonas endophytica]